MDGWGFTGRLRFEDTDVDYVTVPNPAVGANAIYKRSSAQAVRVIAARALLTTDANAANRLVALDYITGNAQTVVRNPANSVIVANATSVQLEWNSAWKSGSTVANTPIVIPVLDCILDAGMSIQFTVDNKQVGDQLSALSLVLLTIPTGYGAS